MVRGRAIGAALATLLLASAPAAAAPPGTPAPLPGGPPGPPGLPCGFTYAGEFAVTYYWVALEDSRFAALPRDAVLRDAAGSRIAAVSAAFRRELDREGTGRLADGRTLNVGTRAADGLWRYRVVAGWGEGTGGLPLVPFLSAATDPAALATGARLYVPALAGFRLPDGSAHEGLLEADDVGAAIRGKRLDIFIGDRALLPLFEGRLPSHASVAVFVRAGVRGAD